MTVACKKEKKERAEEIGDNGASKDKYKRERLMTPLEYYSRWVIHIKFMRNIVPLFLPCGVAYASEAKGRRGGLTTFFFLPRVSDQVQKNSKRWPKKQRNEIERKVYQTLSSIEVS